MHPRDQISAPFFTLFLLWTHSGAMYCGVPTKLAWLKRFFNCYSIFSMSWRNWGWVKSSELPKSIRVTLCKSCVKNMFSGFRSRCTISSECSFFTDSQIFWKVKRAKSELIMPKERQCYHNSFCWGRISWRKYKEDSSRNVPISRTQGKSLPYFSANLLSECFSKIISPYLYIPATFYIEHTFIA